jgi:hypothetical protein
LLVSDTIFNDATISAIQSALKAVGKEGQPAFLRKGAAGPEGDQFRILAGTDNNYSYLDTAGHNPEFLRDYDVISIKIVAFDSKTNIQPAMSMGFKKKNQ